MFSFVAIYQQLSYHISSRLIFFATFYFPEIFETVMPLHMAQVSDIFYVIENDAKQ